MSEIRFLHAADLHLDSPFKGMSDLPKERLRELRESTFQSFDRFIRYAVQEKPDFIVIVGDIYDGEDRSLRAQQKFHEGMGKLQQENIPVLLSYGNHDHLGGRWTRFDMPDNVRIFQGEVSTEFLRIRGIDVYVHGFSYPERHVTEAMIGAFPQAGNDDSIHIGMLHGSIAGDQSHAVYAPFTKEQLIRKQYDYWALGHIHKRQLLHMDPSIVYPGNLQSRHRNERGVKGFYDVTLEKGSTRLSFVPSSSIVFDEIHVSCEGIFHANEWLTVCGQAIERFRSLHGAGVCEVILTDVSPAFNEMFGSAPMEEWLRLLRETVEDDEPFIWISSVGFADHAYSETEMNALTESVLLLMEEWTIEQWKEIVSEVYQHTKGIRYIEPLNEQDFEKLKREASATIIKEMAGME